MRFSSEAQVASEGDTLTVRYLQDGDEAEIIASPRRMKTERRGLVSLSLLFQNGVRTDCILREGGAEAAVPIENTVYRFRLDGRKCALFLSYDLVYQTKQHFNVTMDILFQSEEK